MAWRTISRCAPRFGGAPCDDAVHVLTKPNCFVSFHFSVCQALLLSHPFSHVRDTAKYRPLQKSRGKPRRLQYLANKILGVRIQVHPTVAVALCPSTRSHPNMLLQDKAEGAHDPAEDARAALMVYKQLKRDWEEYILKKQKRSLRTKKKAEKAKKRIAAKQAATEAKDNEKKGEEEGIDFDEEGMSFAGTAGFNFDDDSQDDEDGSG
jgi:hypothetical protein